MALCAVLSSHVGEVGEVVLDTMWHDVNSVLHTVVGRRVCIAVGSVGHLPASGSVS